MPNFGTVLVDFYRASPGAAAAAASRLSRVRRAQSPLFDEQGRPREDLAPEDEARARLELRGAQAVNAAERDAEIAGELTLGAGRRAENAARALTMQSDIARRDAAAQAERMRIGNILETGFADPMSPEARAAARAAQNRLDRAGGGARQRGVILESAAATNPFRTEPEIPGAGIAWNPELAETIVNRSHRADAASDLQRQADEQFAQGNTTEANKLRRTAGEIRTQLGTPEAREAMVGRPFAHRTESGGIYGGAEGRPPDLATRARMKEGILRRLAEGRSVLDLTRAAGTTAQAQAERTEAEARAAGSHADILGRIAAEAPTSALLGVPEEGGADLEAAAVHAELAAAARERGDEEGARMHEDAAIAATGGEVVETPGVLGSAAQGAIEGAAAPGSAAERLGRAVVGAGKGVLVGAGRRILGQTGRRIVPRARPGLGVYTSGGRGMGLYTSPPRTSVLLPAEGGPPATHGAGTLTLTGERPPARMPLPTAARLATMSDEQLNQTARDHPGDRMTRWEVARRAKRTQ